MKSFRITRPKFALGEVIVTAQAMATLTDSDIQLALRRHVSGDLGKIGKEDRPANEQALLASSRLLSVYQTFCWREILDHHRVRPFCNNHTAALRVLTPQPRADPVWSGLYLLLNCVIFYSIEIEFSSVSCR